MLRLMSFLTLAVVALCFLIGAGIALADDTVARGENTVPGPAAVIDASRPEAAGFEQNLAASSPEDVYEFDDYNAEVRRPAGAVQPTEIRSC